MLKHTVTYEDFNGKAVTEDLYFNFTKAELAEMELSEEGGFSSLMEKITAEADPKVLMKYFRQIVLGAYGERSADGKRFVKDEAAQKAFASSEAYSEFFMHLISDTQNVINFVNSVAPKDLVEEGNLANQELLEKMKAATERQKQAAELQTAPPVLDASPVQEAAPAQDPQVNIDFVNAMSDEQLKELIRRRQASGENS